MALPKVHRLTRRQDFTQVYEKGRRRSSKDLTLRILLPISATDASPHPSFTQIGVTVSLKVSKRAVVRNRIKRRILAGLQTLLPDLFPGLKIVVSAKPSVTQCNYVQILQQLKQLLIEIEVLNGHS